MGTDEMYDDGAMRRVVAYALVSTELNRNCHTLAEEVGDALRSHRAPERTAADFARFAASWQLQALRTDLAGMVEDITSTRTPDIDICGSPQREASLFNPDWCDFAHPFESRPPWANSADTFNAEHAPPMEFAESY